jgi:hypothetical protein
MIIVPMGSNDQPNGVKIDAQTGQVAERGWLVCRPIDAGIDNHPIAATEMKNEGLPYAGAEN